MPPTDCALGGGPACAIVPECIAEPGGCQCIHDQCMPLPPMETLFAELQSRRYPLGNCLLDIDCGEGGVCRAQVACLCSQHFCDMWKR